MQTHAPPEPDQDYVLLRPNVPVTTRLCIEDVYDGEEERWKKEKDYSGTVEM